MKQTLIAALLGLWTSAAAAEDAWHWQPTLGLAAGYFDYEETDGGRRVNRESGAMPGVIGEIKGIYAPWFGTLRGSFFAADVDYDGQTNLGTPLTTVTYEAIAEGELRAGRRFILAPRHELEAYLGAGLRWWSRDIRSTAIASGVIEIYRWPFVMAGLEYAWSVTPEDTLSLDVRGWPRVNPGLKVDFKNGYDDAKLNPEGEGGGGRITLAWERRIQARKSVLVELWYERWDLGKSAEEPLSQGGVVVGTLYEPASTTEFIGLSLSLRWL